METSKPCIAEIKSRGQLTIPKKIREISNLEEGQAVTILPIGDSVLITPKKLELDEARRQLKKILRDSGCSLEELLAGIKGERKSLYKEIYGQKDK
jgi:AbrB family looped-hinge helix DNA binding protein